MNATYTVLLGNADPNNAEMELELERAEQFIVSIMNGEVKPIPGSNGTLRVLNNVVSLETGDAGDIVIRSITEPFWQECIKAVNTPNLRIRIAAVGTPGIGKTTSTPLLIRMLLEKGETVVYLIRTKDKSDWYYEFIPNGTIITVSVHPEKLAESVIPSLKVPTSFYIVDPGQTKDDCTPKDKFLPKVIIFPSPDWRHWGESDFDKDRGKVRGEFKYFPTWSFEELILARPVLGPDLTVEQVAERFRQVGGVPRHIFAASIFGRVAAQDAAIAALSPNQVKRIALGRMNAFDRFNAKTKSAVLAIRLAADDNGTFTKMETYIVSDLVVEKMCAKFRNDLWNIRSTLNPTAVEGPCLR